MRLARSRLQRLAGLGATGATAALLAGGSRALPLGLWRCPLRQLTGIPCPTCYLTRSVLAALQGNLAQALQWHAFGPVLVVLGAALGLWMAAGGSVSLPWLARAGGALAVLGWLYWLLRLWGWSQGVAPPALG